jgi:hypothetical protein
MPTPDLQVRWVAQDGPRYRRLSLALRQIDPRPVLKLAHVDKELATTVAIASTHGLGGIDAVVRKKRSVAVGQFTSVSKFVLRSRERRHQFDFHLH